MCSSRERRRPPELSPLGSWPRATHMKQPSWSSPAHEDSTRSRTLASQTHPAAKMLAGGAKLGDKSAAELEAERERERKRLRHRAYVKKSYNKKINTLATLRKELETLEAQYAAMLARQPAARDDENSPVMQKYLELTELKNRFRAENQQLYELNAEFTKTEDRIGQLTDGAEELPDPSSPELKRFHVTPLPEAEYAKVIAEARDDVINFAYSSEKLSTGARVLGWTDQRKIQGNELKFGLEKEFPGISAYELLQRSWPIFSSPELFPKIYSAQIEVKFHVLQHVNDDTVLFYRVIRSPAVVDRLVKTVFLLARVRIAEGYMMLFKSIDKDRVQFREDEIAQLLDEIHSMSSTVTSSESLVATSGTVSEVWVDKYIWVLFQDRGVSVGSHKDKKCLFHFGGSTVTNIWLQEVLFIALRWESMAVGPVFTIPNE